jgi:hypothetical protein
MHWTRHPSRLNRDFGRKRWGDEGYAIEELVAELGSAFLSADLGLTPELRDDHAAYIASWIKVLKDDTRAIFSAASHAQRAADFLHGLQNPSSARIQTSWRTPRKPGRQSPARPQQPALRLKREFVPGICTACQYPHSAEVRKARGRGWP